MHSASYVDRETQTVIEGLVNHPAAVPPELSPSTPPPDDLSIKNEHMFPARHQQHPDVGEAGKQPSHQDQLPLDSQAQVPRPKRRLPFRARISLPELNLDAEGPNSPPPTEAVMSPLPAANKLHAGHTPIFPRSLSPLQVQEPSSGAALEPEPEPEPEIDLDEALHGPLTLPPKPGDGADDRIELKALDAELEKIAREQGTEEQIDTGFTTGQNTEEDDSGSRRGSAGPSRRSSADEDVEVIDGIRLKKQRMNMGAPLGQA